VAKKFAAPRFFFFEKYLQVSNILRKFAYQFIKKENNMESNKYSNLGIGVKLVKHFPFMADDDAIIYGVDLDGQKKGGVELVDESPYDTTFYIFQNDGKYGVSYTVESPQTRYEPAHTFYDDVREVYDTRDEAEDKLIEMIKDLVTAMNEPNFDYSGGELFEK